jgi:ABC-type Fe3+/spermidine/putrescine transport system ATPase subunit
MKTAAIAVTSVTKCFGSHLALDSVSVEIPRGDTAVVLGPSGCGKTTLLRVIAGLEIPDRGRILLDGAAVGEGRRVIVPPHRRRLGFVFQDLALWPHLTVLQHLDFVLRSWNVPRTDRHDRALEALRLVRVESLSARYPHELSGGEQQRVALARAIVGRPHVLLLDEPLSSLDPDLRSAMRSELAGLRRALDLTMVYVTHDREDAAALADRVIEMRAGRIRTVQDSRREERP